MILQNVPNEYRTLNPPGLCEGVHFAAYGRGQTISIVKVGLAKP